MWAFACIYAEVIQGFPLFTSSNEIEQISKIAEILGTPDERNWKTIVNMPDYGKIQFGDQERKKLEEVLVNAMKIETEFLEGILKYENRMSSEEVKF